MRPLAFAVTIAAMIAAAPAFAVQDKKPDDSAKLQKRICRSMQVTGSMMPKRECHTAAEWKQQDDANANNVEQMRNRGSQGGARTN